ncbi:hypothetical protein BGW39_003711 [Mortierella sp. 14UC]|nr:hypothetical protein BGW39_003711 [Mortierella sp. 14UC]
MKITALSVAALLVAPALTAKTWDVSVVNGLFSPQELNPNNDSADHATVQTNNGARSCNNLAEGFNSGLKTKGQANQRTFPTAGSINYKDGVSANCARGAVGTINVGTAGNVGISGAATGTQTAAPIISPTNRPNSASYLTPESSVFLGVAAFLGALAL